MAETLAPAEERGTLDVRVKAIQHLVEHAVRATPGTVAHRSALGRLRGTNSPSATVTIHGNSARVDVDVACLWPSPIAQIVTRVRDTVLEQAEAMTGIHVRSVDVTIHTVTPADLDQPEGRRVE